MSMVAPYIACFSKTLLVCVNINSSSSSSLLSGACAFSCFLNNMGPCSHSTCRDKQTGVQQFTDGWGKTGIESFWWIHVQTVAQTCSIIMLKTRRKQNTEGAEIAVFSLLVRIQTHPWMLSADRETVHAILWLL
jgi:hypothetical protein